MKLKKDTETAPTPAPHTTSLAARLMGASPADLSAMLSNSKFLPSFKIMHPIDSPELGLAGFAVISTDGQVQKLVAPYRLSVLSVRYAARRLDDAGDGKKAYTRAFAGGKSADLYAQLCAEAKAGGREREMLGKSALLAILTGDGASAKCAICSMDMYATGGSYVEKPFAAGLSAAKCCVRVSIDNHLCNLKSNPKDPTRKFYAREKFTQWTPEELTSAQEQLIASAMEAARGAVEDWLNK